MNFKNLQNWTSLCKKNFILWSVLLCTFLAPSLSLALIRVRIAPVQGNSKYPLVMMGLKQVLSSDLEQTGQFELGGANGGKANVEIKMHFKEGTPHFLLSVRAYDVQTGYNLGSQQLRGTYGEIKFLQDRLFDAAMGLLRTSVPTQEKVEITRFHTSQVGAIQALGEAGAALRRKEYVKAFEGFARSQSIDSKFKAPQHELEKRGKNWVGKLTDPEQAGRAYAFMGDTKKSMLRYDEALRRNPSNPRALIGKGDLYLQSKNPGKAMSFYKRAAAKDPKDAMAQVGLARAYEALGRSHEALMAYEKARDLGATRPEVFEALGSLYSLRKRAKAASEAYQTAGALAERVRHFSLAQSAYARANKIFTSAQSLEKQADVYLSIGEAEPASILLRKAIFLDPNRDSLHSKLGYSFYLSQRPSQAIKELNKAFELNHANYEANLYLGILYLEERDRRAQAIRHLENATRLRPDNPETRYHLAKAYLLDNRISAAVSVLQELTKTNPRDFRTQVQLGEALLVSKDFGGAVSAFSRAIETNPEYLAAREGLAKAYIHQGDRESAIQAIRDVYAIDATNNFFVNAGDELLGRIVSPELLLLCRRFPKMVPSEVGMSAINQVIVAHLQPNLKVGWPVIKKYLFEPFEIDTKRIRQDLELAFLAQYRVIQHTHLKHFKPKEVTFNSFGSPGYLEPELAKDSLDGIFAFDIAGHETRENNTSVSFYIQLFSPISEERVTLDTRISYPTPQIRHFNKWLPILWSIILLLFVLPPLYLARIRSTQRGKGNLMVIINYDPKMESFLTLKLSKKKEKEKDSGPLIVSDREKYEKKKYKQLLKQKGAWVRKMVGKQTLFENVPARDYFVYLYGTIEDTALTKKTIGNYYMFQKARVEKGKTRQIVFQLVKEESFVTIFVRRGEEEVQGVELRIPGDPDVKYVKPGTGGFIYLKQGNHKIQIIHGEDSWIYPITIPDLEDRVVNIDLDTLPEPGGEEAEEETVTMAGTPDNSYSDQSAMSHGELDLGPSPAEEAANISSADLDPEVKAQALVKERKLLEAAQIYHDAGNMDKAKYLFGVHAYQEGDLEKALEYLEDSKHHAVLAKIYTKKGDVKKAAFATAHIYLSKGQKVEAAQCFVKAEAWAQAAEIYEQIGDLGKAAVLYAKDGDFALAGEFFAQAGDPRRAAMSFEKGGLLDQAITLYKELNEIDKVIDLFIRKEHFLEAATIYQEQGLIDEAIALCQKVPSYHQDLRKAQVLLGKMFVEKGVDDLAIKTLREVYDTSPADMDQESQYIFATVLERAGEFQSSLDIFEDLLKKDFHFRDVAQKVDEIKEKMANARPQASSPAHQETIAGAQTAEEKRYEIMDELGRGAMGIVYRAKDTMLDRVVAFKTLPHTLRDDAEALQSLMREAQTAAKLNHPNIVTIYDVGQEGGNYFIAMEFVEGKTLQQVLQKVKRVNEENFRAIAKPLCEVIDYAHSQKVIHRDVKPSNILLMASRQVKLMDFGLAKVLQDLSIDKTMLRGTPLYMSPEQVLGKDIDHRTDIYSLAVIFYELLAGRPPFIEGDIMYAHLHTQPPALSDLAQNVPDSIIQVIMQALSKDKTKRPNTATEFAQQLGL